MSVAAVATNHTTKVITMPDITRIAIARLVEVRPASRMHRILAMRVSAHAPYNYKGANRQRWEPTVATRSASLAHTAMYTPRYPRRPQ
jgi:hypothetical protein